MKKIFFLLLISIIIFFFLPIVINDDVSDEKTRELVTKIDDPLVDYNFLKWVYLKYGKRSIKQLNNSLTNGYDKSLWHGITGESFNVMFDRYNDIYDKADNVKELNKKGDITLAFVGDVSLADNFYIMPKYDERNKGILGILSKEVVSMMVSSDVMVVNSEFTVSNRGTAIPGKMYTFKANPSRLMIYEEMGVDLVTLANNHVYDYGELAFNDMIDSFNEYNIPYVGAGKNIDEAMRPYYFIINGYKIAFVNATRAEKTILTPEAKKDSGGVFRCYDPNNLKKIITDAKMNSDYVIALIHYGREDSTELEIEQVNSSHEYIDIGADMVIGTHAHVLQGIEFYKDKAIFYNLGDFIFNNETKDTALLQVKIDNEGILNYYFIPAIQKNEYTEFLHDSEKMRVINKINKLNINAKILDDGHVVSK